MQQEWRGKLEEIKSGCLLEWVSLDRELSREFGVK